MPKQMALQGSRVNPHSRLIDVLAEQGKPKSGVTGLKKSMWVHSCVTEVSVCLCWSVGCSMWSFVDLYALKENLRICFLSCCHNSLYLSNKIWVNLMLSQEICAPEIYCSTPTVPLNPMSGVGQQFLACVRTNLPHFLCFSKVRLKKLEK